MNDRTQGGTADVANQATIELMQHRRAFDEDHKGNNEGLNETDAQGYGIRVNARYHMQIFDITKGKSLQR